MKNLRQILHPSINFTHFSLPDENPSSIHLNRRPRLNSRLSKLWPFRFDFTVVAILRYLPILFGGSLDIVKMVRESPYLSEWANIWGQTVTAVKTQNKQTRWCVNWSAVYYNALCHNWGGFPPIAPVEGSHTRQHKAHVTQQATESYLVKVINNSSLPPNLYLC